MAKLEDVKRLMNPQKPYIQLAENPEAIYRQIPAVKQGILKIADCKNLHVKYDNMGLEPGDSLLKPVFLQEFHSISLLSKLWLFSTCYAKYVCKVA